MAAGWKWIAALAAVGVASIAAGDDSPPPSTGGGGIGGGSMQGTDKQKLYAQLEALPMLDEDQRLFLMLVAHGESRYHPRAHNDSDEEREASAKAFDRIAARFAACGRSREQYAIGSVGRFQRLAPYFCNDLRDLVPCIDPLAGLDGLHDIVSAIANARALQGYARWNGRVSGLRGGWGTIAWLDAPPAPKVEKWTRHATEAGLPVGFIDRTLKRFPGDLAAILHALQAVGPAVA